MKTWRLLPLRTFDASTNMALDEALLRLHAQGKAPPTVRFYQWSSPAISLGRFQSPEGLDLAACRRLGIALVRRSTGGRAVLHQGDLTYSVVAGTADGIPATLTASYGLLCRGLVEGLRLLGIEAQPGREATRSAGPVACFLRSAGGDLTHQGRKFVGNAQCRRGESVLQHGSLLLEPQECVWAELLKAPDQATVKTPLANKTTSMSAILGRPVEAGEVAQALASGLAQTLKIHLEAGMLTPEERALAEEIASREFPTVSLPSPLFELRFGAGTGIDSATAP